MHILIVDDCKTDRFVLRKILETNHKVTTLSSVHEARAFARSSSFDVALLNVMIAQDMDAVTLLEDLRSVCPFSFIPFAITSYVDERRYRLLMQVGFVAVMKKPFDAEVFHRHLETINYSLSA